MSNKSPLTIELYDTLIQDGYSEQFAKLVTDNLNTDFTAGRMLGYLAHYDHLPEVEIADEMLAIISDRKQIMDKKATMQLGIITGKLEYLTTSRKNKFYL